MTTAAPAFDFAVAADRMAALVAGIGDDQLAARTPCPDVSVAALLGHVAGLTEAFRQAATKEVSGSRPPEVAASELPADWRTLIPARLDALVDAWREPDAWAGETEAGGVTAPAPAMAAVALDELVIHGWDLARATGLPFDITPDELEVLEGFLAEVPDEGTPGLFGPVQPVAPGASRLDRVLARTGRRADWTA
ncbi:TIGR03086 family metal-binding protein [Nocardia sp. NPDC057353]|uniref:TIGR03086 family metal-binding protein n=1 Tax=Nocardia sp. NPDC057353 TaxID=3346104 RepID=UPI0036286AB4